MYTHPGLCYFCSVTATFGPASAGFFFFIEFLVNFHVGFIGKNNTRRKLIMDGRAIAWYYVTQGHFMVDLLTVIVWIAQARPQCLCSTSTTLLARGPLVP